MGIPEIPKERRPPKDTRQVLDEFSKGKENKDELLAHYPSILSSLDLGKASPQERHYQKLQEAYQRLFELFPELASARKPQVERQSQQEQLPEQTKEKQSEPEVLHIIDVPDEPQLDQEAEIEDQQAEEGVREARGEMSEEGQKTEGSGKPETHISEKGSLARAQNLAGKNLPESKQSRFDGESGKQGLPAGLRQFLIAEVKIAVQFMGFKNALSSSLENASGKTSPFQLTSLLVGIADLEQEASALLAQTKQASGSQTHTLETMILQMKNLESQLKNALLKNNGKDENAISTAQKNALSAFNELKLKMDALKQELNLPSSMSKSDSSQAAASQKSAAEAEALAKALKLQNEIAGKLQSPSSEAAISKVTPEQFNGLSSLKTALSEARPQASLPIPAKNFSEIEHKIQSLQNKQANFPVTFSLPFPVALQSGKAGSKKAEAQAADAEDESFDDDTSGGGEEKQQIISWVPKGRAIFGDPFNEGREDELPPKILETKDFLIASTQVTNHQFATCLNQMLKKGDINRDKKGQVFDRFGMLLAKTTECEPLSQIHWTANTSGEMRFKALSGKEYHPVVFVTFHGALLFCLFNKGRLPTELEWEKAAAMKITHFGESLVKYRYGFSDDVIEQSMANFAEGYNLELRKTNLTLPAGFFNGNTVFMKLGKRIETKNAASPYGCYDMSGNVREWVSGGYEGEEAQQITKGGSYDSPAYDLRVSAKTSLHSDHCDPYTGFRIAFDLT